MAQEYELGKAPHIVISRCDGSLIVKGGPPLVTVRGDEATVEESPDGLTVSSQGRLRLHLPPRASLTVRQANGDVIVKNLEGAVQLDQVAGDVVLAALQEATIGVVHGDLSAKAVAGRVSATTVSGDTLLRAVGQVQIETVHGDLSARAVAGNVVTGTVMGDMSLRQVGGDVEAGAGLRDAHLRLLAGQTNIGPVSGDIRLHGELAAGKHVFESRGDIVVRWPSGAPLTLSATAPTVTNRLPLEEVSEQDGTLSGRIGQNGPVLTLAAGGRIILKELQEASDEWEPFGFGSEDFDFGLDVDLAGLGAQISAQVSQQMSRLTSELEGKFGPEFTQKMAEKIAGKAEKAAARAEKAAERARRRMEHRMAQESYRRRPSPPPPPPRPKSAPRAAAAEQLKILKMVEDGVITPDEASMLLDALES